jgi:hypothetical protein
MRSRSPASQATSRRVRASSERPWRRSTPRRPRPRSPAASATTGTARSPGEEDRDASERPVLDRSSGPAAMRDAGLHLDRSDESVHHRAERRLRRRDRGAGGPRRPFRLARADLSRVVDDPRPRRSRVQHRRACLDPIFGPTATKVHWSSTTSSADPNRAHVGDFSEGDTVDVSKTSAIAARAVRREL